MSSFAREKRRGTAAAIAVSLACALLPALAGSASAAAPNWLDPADLSLPGRNASNPAVAMAADGETISVWERQSTVDPSHNLQISTRSAGGSFTAPADLALRGNDPHLAITPGGAAAVAWQHLENPPGVHTIQVATRPPGGAVFTAPTTVYAAPPGTRSRRKSRSRSAAAATSL